MQRLALAERAKLQAGFSHCSFLLVTGGHCAERPEEKAPGVGGGEGGKRPVRLTQGPPVFLSVSIQRRNFPQSLEFSHSQKFTEECALAEGRSRRQGLVSGRCPGEGESDSEEFYRDADFSLVIQEYTRMPAPFPKKETLPCLFRAERRRYLWENRDSLMGRKLIDPIGDMSVLPVSQSFLYTHAKISGL